MGRVIESNLNTETEENIMGARKKLNSGYVTGSLIIAGAFGVASQSWIVFIIVLVLTLAANLYERNLR